MTTGAFLLFILLAVAGAIAWKMARNARARASEKKWRPQELLHAQLAFAEKTFKTWQPIRLIARADRGYRWKEELHLAEFKTRTRPAAHLSDVIELSAQWLAIKASTGERVSDTGYVLVQDPLANRRSVHKVRLLSEAAVVAWQEDAKPFSRAASFQGTPIHKDSAGIAATTQSANRIYKCRTRP